MTYNRTTTLNEIRKHLPCTDSWCTLLYKLGKTKADDEPLEYKYILDTLGLADAIWALTCKDKPIAVRRFAIKCAEYALLDWLEDKELPQDVEVDCVKLIDIASRYMCGAISFSVLMAASDSIRTRLYKHENEKYYNVLQSAMATCWHMEDNDLENANEAARQAAWFARYKDTKVDEYQRGLYIDMFC